jgi:hypothetical protein
LRGADPSLSQAGSTADLSTLFGAIGQPDQPSASLIR